MTNIVETGRGVRNANAYVDRAFVDTYLKTRGRSSENGWGSLGGSDKDAFIVAATDYIEQRWGRQFKGVREFSFDDVKAEGSVLFTGLPVAAETLQVGDQVYTFVVALTSPAVFDEVLIGVDAAANASNLFDALTAAVANEGVTYGTGTQSNGDVSPTLTGATVELVAEAPGSSGDSTVLVGPVTNAALTAIAGGDDGGSQVLSFPQTGLFDRAGIRVEGIPLRLKQATAEYAVRAASSTLAPDPTVDAIGGSITSFREKIGPIEEETTYGEGTSGTVVLRPYPAADRLLLDYVFPAGQVVR